VCVCVCACVCVYIYIYIYIYIERERERERQRERKQYKLDFFIYRGFFIMTIYNAISWYFKIDKIFIPKYQISSCLERFCSWLSTCYIIILNLKKHNLCYFLNAQFMRLLIPPRLKVYIHFTWHIWSLYLCVHNLYNFNSLSRPKFLQIKFLYIISSKTFVCFISLWSKWLTFLTLFLL